MTPGYAAALTGQDSAAATVAGSSSNACQAGMSKSGTPIPSSSVSCAARWQCRVAADAGQACVASSRLARASSNEVQPTHIQGCVQVRVDAVSGRPAGVLICKGRSVFRCMSGGQRPRGTPRVTGSALPQRLDRLVVCGHECRHDRVCGVSEHGAVQDRPWIGQKVALTAPDGSDDSRRSNDHSVCSERCRCCVAGLRSHNRPTPPSVQHDFS